MNTSGGGGYCDCGDREAWRSGAFCDIHKCGVQQEQNERQVKHISSLRMHAVFAVLLSVFCFQMFPLNTIILQFFSFTRFLHPLLVPFLVDILG